MKKEWDSPLVAFPGRRTILCGVEVAEPVERKFVTGGFSRTERRTPIVQPRLDRLQQPDADLVGLRAISPIFKGR